MKRPLTHTNSIVRLILLPLFIYLIIENATAQANVTANDTILLWVTVAEVTMVDIQPDQLGWQNVPPGSETNKSQLAYPPGAPDAIQIENIGSTNITEIWFNTSYPSSLPFGMGDISLYDAGNFVVLRRNESGAEYFFVNRVEYNESEVIYLNVPSGYAHGRFRSANSEYFWAIDVSDGWCNDSDFRIGKNPHNQTELGTVDLTTCDAGAPGQILGLGGNECRQGTLDPTPDNQWGWADIYIGPNTDYENYTVAVYANCSQYVRVMFYHWNMDAPGVADGANHPEYFSTTPLYPGGRIIANIHLRVPYGTMAGNITGAMTVHAKSTY
ncbi:MAG: hypothetical protein DRO95_02045 [Candidatus Altiarchaeales archaeon]|nr:MAG: hypothetical protein DRO95_02045 [Candidatus Altiarchaeales archaeon]HDO82295.1 hypothetical protein [Candidatus Altiarchaeales archaeon]HEX54944.1 hypothetical protein [Candidatus Altiarchaeales archaeon]